MYGLAPYELMAPRKSYIDVFDFKNLTQLAEYIQHLDSNDTAYNEYFQWVKCALSFWYIYVLFILRTMSTSSE